MSTKIRKLTKASKVLERLRNDIIEGRFKPNERLQMETLKKRYAVGLSPVREALSRLVTHGLVEIEEQCGFKVAALSLEDFYDLYKMRAHIEALALEYSIAHGDDCWEAGVITTWHRYAKYLSPTNKNIEPTEWERLHQDFRFALLKGCQSPWLLKMRSMLHDQASRYRMMCYGTSFKNKKLLKSIVKENELLVDAVLARDKKKALKLYCDSFDTSVKIIAEALQNKLKNK